MAFSGKAMRFLDSNMDASGSTVGAGDGINTLRRVRDVSNEIALLDANNTALLALLRRLRKKKASDVKFEWFEDSFPTQYINMTNTQTTSSSDTDWTLEADEVALMRAGDLWMNGDSGEVIYIKSVDSTTTVTILRGVGGTTVSDVAAGDTFYYIGNGQKTGDSARTPLTTQTVQVYNYCQLFKEAFEIDNTANATKLYGGPERQYLRYKHAQVHNRDIEKALWFGVRDSISNSTDGRLAYTSKGLVAEGGKGFITTNQSTANSSGEYTEDEFDVDLQTAFRYGNGVKFMFCSPMAMSVVSSWGRDASLQILPRADTLGVHITRYVSPHGELNLINEKMWQDFSSAGTVWQAGWDYSKMAVILDMENLWFRTLRDTQLEMNIQNNDDDTTEDQYLTEAGLEVHNEETCMAIFGFDLT